MKKRFVLVAMALLLALAGVASVIAGPPDKDLGQGWKEYVTVKVDWDGDPSHTADWNVYAGPYWVALHPDSGKNVGDWVAGCSSCLTMEYTFKFVGNTLQFSETYVSGVEAYPQTHHVVLHVFSVADNVVTYKGSVTARYDFPGSAAGVTRMDVIQYIVKANDGVVFYFHYDEVEYIQPNA